eukprot:5755969-Alexandrium_andersonii.AAC.1
MSWKRGRPEHPLTLPIHPATCPRLRKAFPGASGRHYGPSWPPLALRSPPRTCERKAPGVDDAVRAAQTALAERIAGRTKRQHARAHTGDNPSARERPQGYISLPAHAQ